MSIHLEDLEILVLDEADRLLELGFEEEVHEVVKMAPKGRQTMLFSATMSEDIKKLAALSLNRPVRLGLDDFKSAVPTRLRQEFVRIRPTHEEDREAILFSLLTRSFTKRCLIFAQTKWHAHRIRLLCGIFGLRAAELHGNLSQLQRLEALQQFKDGTVDFLVATGLAARGLDISNTETVINFQMPRSVEEYVHRVGRTARAGRDGCAVSLASEQERRMVREIVKTAAGSAVNRQVAGEAIAIWREKLEGVVDKVEKILEEERAEREVRVAEMEVNRAQNVMQHQDEISARPSKSWFQTAAQKQALKERSNAVSQGVDLVKAVSEMQHHDLARTNKRLNDKLKRDEYAGLSRKKRRKIMMERQEKDEKQENDAKGLKTVNREMLQMRAARASKKTIALERVGLIPKPDKSSKLRKSSKSQKKEAPLHEKSEKRKSAGGSSGFKSQKKFRRR